MKKRLIAITLASLLIVCLGFSCLYIALEADHDCHGENCIICCVLSACESVLSGHRSVLAVVSLGLGTLYAFARRFSRSSHCFRVSTPISMHIRLLD